MREGGTIFLGVDIGTSSVKVVILNSEAEQLASASVSLESHRPQHLWSEQDPSDWINAAEAAILQLPAKLRSAVKSLGLTGQMHGATLLDANAKPLRRAILWNDGRSWRECGDINQNFKNIVEISGNQALPGFTAPKLMWLEKHEPETFAQVKKVLLPKDYVRLCWTGESVSDMSDASGTLWLDVERRAWSEQALAETGMNIDQMPRLVEGTDIAGQLRPEVAARLGLPALPVAGGAGDQAAGAIAAGVISPGRASLALGTSGVIFATTEGFAANHADAVHAFCHALPRKWHQMSVILSAASAIDQVARMTGFASPAEAYAAAENIGTSGEVLFLPYLSGERTPHNNPHARGVFFGMTMDTSPAMLVHAALEGVAFAFADGAEAMSRSGVRYDAATVIGGGSQSSYWGEILSAALNIRLEYREGAAAGPAEGAARLAQIATTEARAEDICSPRPIRHLIEPNSQRVDLYAGTLPRWRSIYHALNPLFRQEV